MKPFLVSLLFFLLSAGLSLRAQVYNFSIFKIAVYQQSTPTPPTAPDSPNAFYFGAQLNTTNSDGYKDVYFNGPEDMEFLSENTPFYFDFGSPYFPDKPSFDAVYPSGEYDFYVDYTNSTQTGSVIASDQEFYATNAAAFTTNCWYAMQQVDPAQDFELDWNSFVPTPSTTSAYTFIDIYDEDAGTEPFAADFLTPDTMTTNIPANTLQYGVTYRINAIFSNRQDTQNAGFGGALGTVGMDKLTHTALVTIPPWLQISGAGTNVLISWPTLATNNFELEAAGQLLPGAVWSVITNAPATVGSTNVLTLPATASSQFFRLASLDSM
jgi:hypothetical protein